MFSKDRACQLDLFLRSVTCNAEGLLGSITVLWAASSREYERAYHTCMSQHQYAKWWGEDDFRTQVLELVDHTDTHATFFTDDSVFYRSTEGLTAPDEVLDKNAGMLCFSTRLGLNTGMCYPFNRIQKTPEFTEQDDVLVWNWRTGDADFGYMGSLDGHIYRKNDLMDMVDGARPFSNPNQLEELLAKEVNDLRLPFAGCWWQSRLVGIPVNRVNATHPNRFGDYHPRNQSDLNQQYLEGGRLSLASVKASKVTGAHEEMKLEFE